jgi:hypothetical protein
MTRFEKIKQMSVDELAEVLCLMCRQTETCDGCKFYYDCPESECVDAWKMWLNEEKGGEQK